MCASRFPFLEQPLISLTEKQASVLPPPGLASGDQRGTQRKSSELCGEESVILDQAGSTRCSSSPVSLPVSS